MNVRMQFLLKSKVTRAAHNKQILETKDLSKTPVKTCQPPPVVQSSLAQTKGYSTQPNADQSCGAMTLSPPGNAYLPYIQV